MGNTESTGKGLDGVIDRAELRVGKIHVTGRYHRPPRKLEDDYALSSEVLGSGYNGQVFAGHNKAAGNKVAVKAFGLHGVSKDKKEQLELEVEIFLAMDHPHVVRLMNVYESEDQLDLVMECMTGGELFKRVVDKKRFTERDAADAAYQMLLAINYIHSKGIVHRDIKLENFLFETEESNYLKLIDFGFSKIWQPNTKMNSSVGTMAYVAPEVLRQSYDSQCDMWSFGVTIFIVLFGYMPFAGSEAHQVSRIRAGKYTVKKDIWKRVSDVGQDFVRKLLVVNPRDRLTAEQALNHEWILERQRLVDGCPALDSQIADALVSFGKASAFRRTCMSMMAWSLTAEERKQVRQAFLDMDTNHTGTINLQEFKQVMETNFKLDDQTVLTSFKALDSTNSEEVHYVDFLAAMVSSRIALHDAMLQKTFKRFDKDNSGVISRENLKEVLGGDFSDAQIEQLMQEAGGSDTSSISYADWIEYLRGGGATENHAEVAAHVIDKEISNERKDSIDGLKQLQLFAFCAAGRQTGPRSAAPYCCSLQ